MVLLLILYLDLGLVCRILLIFALFCQKMADFCGFADVFDDKYAFFYKFRKARGIFALATNVMTVV